MAKPPRTGADDGEAPPRWARPFVALFLAAFLVVGLLGLDAWPLTGWRLFSHLRSPHRSTFEAVAVDPGGSERGVAFGRLRPALRGFSLLAGELPGLTPPRRTAVCQAWARAVQGRWGPIRELRIYRREWNLSRRAGGRAVSPTGRSLVVACSPGGRS